MKIIFYLNLKGGAQDGAVHYFDFKADGVPNSLISGFEFRFDSRNPREMIKANSEPGVVVICLSDPEFCLSNDWVIQRISGSLEEGDLADRRAAIESGEDAELILKAICNFLLKIARRTEEIVEAMYDSSPHFDLLGESFGHSGGASIPLDKERTGYSSVLLQRYWYFFECICRGLPQSSVDPRSQSQRDVEPHSSFSEDSHFTWIRTSDWFPAIRANMLKIRAHLAAHLLEHENPFQAAQKNLLIQKYFESIREWVLFNIDQRSANDGGYWMLSRRAVEVRSIVFVSNSGKGWMEQQFSREAVMSVMVVRPAYDHSIKNVSEERKTRFIREHHLLFRRCVDFFSRRYDLPELFAVSSKADKFWGSLGELDESLSRGRKFAVSVVRKISGLVRLISSAGKALPQEYSIIIFLTVVSWGFFWIDNQFGDSNSKVGGIFPEIGNVLIAAHYGVIILMIAKFVFMVLARLQFHRFIETIPRIFGGLLVGYLPLIFAKDMWMFPLKMSTGHVVASLLFFMLISFLYIVIEVASRLPHRVEAIQKSLVIFFIAIAQAYVMGLIAINFMFPSAVEMLSPGVSESGGTDVFGVFSSHCLCVEKGFFGIEFPVILPRHIVVIPKLLFTWMGVSLFIGILVQNLWEKDGILDRVS